MAAASTHLGPGQPGTGRERQKERTKAAILAAARQAIVTGGELRMPAIAQRALVSEATVYRYFPDVPALLGDALAGLWPSPEAMLAPVAHSTDPVERIGFATEALLRIVHAHQPAVRAVLAAATGRQHDKIPLPGRQLALIDAALWPLADTLAADQPAQFDQLRRGLAVILSAHALLTLTDLCGLTPELAIASAIESARSLTAAALHAGGR